MGKLTKSCLLIIVIWAALCSWRPFTLGFYSDDWTQIIAPEATEKLGTDFSSYLQRFYNRPVIGAIFFLSTKALGASEPAYWQIYAAVLVLLTSVCLYIFVREILRYLCIEEVEFYSVLAAVFWLVSPWNLGFTVWSSAVNNAFSMIFYFLSGWSLFYYLNKGKLTFLLPILFFLLSCFTYESFYFQFIPLFIIAFSMDFHKRFGKVKTIYLFGAFLLIQFFVIFWNRIIEFGVTKAFNPHFFETVAANFVHLPYAAFRSAEGISFILIPLFILFVVIVISNFKKNNFDSSDEYKAAVLFIIAILSGILISLIVYSGAGYIVWGMGMRGRTFITVGFWLAVLFSFSVYLLRERFQLSGKLVNVLVGATIILLASATVFRTFDWSKAWSVQKEVIGEFPYEKIKRTDSAAIILIDVPFRYNYVGIFDTFWAADWQIKIGYRFVDSIKVNGRDIIGNRDIEIARNYLDPVKGGKWANIWTGDKLIQKYDEEDSKAAKRLFIQKRITKGSELWIWEYDSGKFYRIVEPKKLYFKNYETYFHWMTSLYRKYIVGGD